MHLEPLGHAISPVSHVVGSEHQTLTYDLAIVASDKLHSKYRPTNSCQGGQNVGSIEHYFDNECTCCIRLRFGNRYTLMLSWVLRYVEFYVMTLAKLLILSKY